jgi:hypothetical protein
VSPSSVSSSRQIQHMSLSLSPSDPCMHQDAQPLSAPVTLRDNGSCRVKLTILGRPSTTALPSAASKPTLQGSQHEDACEPAVVPSNYVPMVQ